MPSKRTTVALFAVALPWFQTAVKAADYTQITVPDGSQNDVTLNPGDTVNYSGPDAAVTVIGASAKFTADGITITAGATTPSQPSKGVLVQSGGKAELTDSTIRTLPTIQTAHALYASGTASTVSPPQTSPYPPAI